MRVFAKTLVYTVHHMIEKWQTDRTSRSTFRATAINVTPPSPPNLPVPYCFANVRWCLLRTTCRNSVYVATLQQMPGLLRIIRKRAYGY